MQEFTRDAYRIPISIRYSTEYRFLSKSLEIAGISPNYLLMYTQPWRHFHGIAHLMKMSKFYLEKIREAGEWNDRDFTIGTAIVMHDIIYDSPITQGNDEMESSKLFMSISKDIPLDRELIRDAILSTKDHRPFENNWVSTILCVLDTEILCSTSIEELINYEKQIFAEYQRYPLNVYIENRCKVLRAFAKEYSNSMLFTLADYVESKRYKIGIYPGSFNPFHIGHLDILRQAENVLDKVIISKGINPEKTQNSISIEGEMRLREVRSFETDLFDYATGIQNEYSADIFIVRGIRNEQDFRELNTQKWYLYKLASQQLRTFYPTLSFMSNDAYTNVSSSGIRILFEMKEKNAIKLANNLIPEKWENSFGLLNEKLGIEKNSRW